jgi:hypothetical protein
MLWENNKNFLVPLEKTMSLRDPLTAFFMIIVAFYLVQYSAASISAGIFE